jgi:hypothetical protein
LPGLFKAGSQNTGLDDLSEYFDSNPKTGGSVMNFFTPHNPSIAHIVSFFWMISIRGDHLDPDIRPGLKVTINLNIKAVVTLINHFSRDYIAAVFTAF